MLLEITYEPLSLPAQGAGQDLAYLEVRSIHPAHAPLPIAPSGFYRHTLARSIVNAAGGPVDYIDVIARSGGRRMSLSDT